mgnify:CR=1 FL=1
MSIWTPWNVKRAYPVPGLNGAARTATCEVCRGRVAERELTDVRRALAEIRDDELADCRPVRSPGRTCEACARKLIGCTEVAYAGQ